MKGYTIFIKILVWFTLAFTADVMFSQVTVGSAIPPERASLLEIKNQEADSKNVTSTKGGLGLPRVFLVDKTTLEPFISLTDTDWTNAVTSKIKEKHAGLMVYNIYESPATETDTNKKFRQGIYIWDGVKWNLETKDDSRYFSPPSFNIPLGTIGTTLTYNIIKNM